MKTPKIFLLIGLLAILGVGCASTDPNVSTYTIVNKYTSEYVQISNTDTNTDNHDISAMLQTITVNLIKEPPSSWNEANNRENLYISLVKTNFISNVYTIRASDNEIRLVDEFCDEIIYYYSVEESGYAHFAGNFLGEAATRLIINMNEYEYEK